MDAPESHDGRGPRAFPVGRGAPHETRSAGVGTWAGECAVNGFHVSAVGWILTFNAFALGEPEAGQLVGLWTDLVHARGEDIRRAHPLRRLLQPRSIPLSERTLAAFAALVDRMASLHPERFGCDALCQRRDHWALQAALGFLLWVLTATVLPKTWPLAEEIVRTFFMMGCGFVVPTVTLWRAASAVKHLSANRNVRWSPPQRTSSRLR